MKQKRTLPENTENKSACPLNSENIKAELLVSKDFITKDITINNKSGTKAVLFYFEGMVDLKMIDDDILRPLLQERSITDANNSEDIIDSILSGSIYHTEITVSEDLNECISKIIGGNAAIVFDDVCKAVLFKVKGYETRSVGEPSSENVVKGSKESFVESLTVNTTLVRRRIRTPKLRIEQITVGRQTVTPVSIIYIDGLTNNNIVNELRKRLQSINVDGVIFAQAIEENIIDNKLTPFPQTTYMERVDTFCLNILEGRAGILIDGLPIAYTVPITMEMFYRATEDYAQNYLVASAIRILRYFTATITVFLPSLYISITTFHQEMIPSTLATSIISSKEGVPFPTFIEVLIMLGSFEVLLEAGLRLPRSIGQALSIVGALIVGDAAVNARAVSPVVVIVVALTAICGFVVPNQDLSNALRLCRFFLVLLSSVLGLLGMALGTLLIFIHESTLYSFGVPYLAPFSSTEGKGLFGDAVIRPPLFVNKTRPENLKTTNKKRNG
ncbi:MAG: Spore germination protein B1 [Firmicutes bacterium ADurb.Bin193]|nr:MAG: Spore germination protein B1 [Firmicutes bacterium ADurb.Bin193]